MDKSYKVDRTNWPQGEWDNELDFYFDNRFGVPEMIIRTNGGQLCGYVGFPEGHPFFGKHYSDPAFTDILVHGGLTFSGDRLGFLPEGHPCRYHWWLGFDCGHLGDLSPVNNEVLGFYNEMLDFVKNLMSEGEEPTTKEIKSSYKNLDFVKKELEKLTLQLKDLVLKV